MPLRHHVLRLLKHARGLGQHGDGLLVLPLHLGRLPDARQHIGRRGVRLADLLHDEREGLVEGVPRLARAPRLQHRLPELLQEPREAVGPGPGAGELFHLPAQHDLRVPVAPDPRQELARRLRRQHGVLPRRAARHAHLEAVEHGGGETAPVAPGRARESLPGRAELPLVVRGVYPQDRVGVRGVRLQRLPLLRAREVVEALEGGAVAGVLGDEVAGQGEVHALPLRLPGHVTRHHRLPDGRRAEAQGHVEDGAGLAARGEQQVLHLPVEGLPRGGRELVVPQHAPHQREQLVLPEAGPAGGDHPEGAAEHPHARKPLEPLEEVVHEGGEGPGELREDRADLLRLLELLEQLPDLLHAEVQVRRPPRLLLAQRGGEVVGAHHPREARPPPDGLVEEAALLVRGEVRDLDHLERGLGGVLEQALDVPARRGGDDDLGKDGHGLGQPLEAVVAHIRVVEPVKHHDELGVLGGLGHELGEGGGELLGVPRHLHVEPEVRLETVADAGERAPHVVGESRVREAVPHHVHVLLGRGRRGVPRGRGWGSRAPLPRHLGAEDGGGRGLAAPGRADEEQRVGPLHPNDVRLERLDHPAPPHKEARVGRERLVPRRRLRLCKRLAVAVMAPGDIEGANVGGGDGAGGGGGAARAGDPDLVRVGGGLDSPPPGRLPRGLAAPLRRRPSPGRASGSN
mmetsp:Transcript_15691/g.49292  ORF Transcript_15691/g.49292 Transcript_15691/m.49292 type:complete len:686 (-) Transcript_15691:210-2267(-)